MVHISLVPEVTDSFYHTDSLVILIGHKTPGILFSTVEDEERFMENCPEKIYRILRLN